MAVNPKTKQLRQQLRAASMERNDAAAFALLAKIVEIDPGDSDVVEQKKVVGRRLFDTEVVELAQLIDAGDNDQLLIAMERLESYVDHGYAMKSPTYAEAMEIVKVCRQEQMEGKVREMLAQMTRLNNVAEKDRMAVQIETLATNSGLALRAEYKKILNKVHKERQREIDRNNQLEQLEELNKSAYDLGERLKILKQTFDKGACEEILTTVGSCASKFNGLNLLEEDEKAETGRVFESIQRETYETRKRYVTSMRIRVAVRSILSFVVISVVAFSIYLWVTVKNRSAKLNMHLAQSDFLYIQEEMRSPMSSLYSKVSSEYASLLNRCKMFLKDRSDLSTRYKKDKEELVAMKSNLSPQNVDDFTATMQGLCQVRGMYIQRYKSDLDANWELFAEEIVNILDKYYASRREYFMSVSHKEPLDIIIKKYREYQNEFKNVGDQQKKGVPECYMRALNQKYENYHQLDEKALDVVLSELAQARDAGIPVDEDFLAKVRSLRDGIEAVNTIKKSAQSCRDLDGFVGLINNNANGYKGLPKAYSLSVLKYLSRNPERIKRLAQYKLMRVLCPKVQKIDLEKLSTLKEIFCEGRGNVYMGSLSSSMYSAIKELAAEDKEARTIWPTDAFMCEQQGNIYIGRRSRIGERTLVKGICNNKFVVEVEHKGKDINLAAARRRVGIRMKDLEDGEILPVKILRSILRLNKKDCPALVRLYLYKGVVDLLEKYKNQEASGIAFSPTLQEDVADLKKKTADLKKRKINVTKGCWMEGYRAMLEVECEAYLSSMASHDYLTEIRSNLERIENANFQYCGYIDDTGAAQLFGKVAGIKLYIYSENSEEFVSFSRDKHHTPYTPIFRLTATDDEEQ